MASISLRPTDIASTLTSIRLSYDRISRDDVEDYVNYCGNADCMKYVSRSGKPLAREQATSRFEEKLKENDKYSGVHGSYCVKLKQTETDESESEGDVFVGFVKCSYEDEDEVESTLLPLTKAEVGYGMLPEFWGKGYGTEMLGALVRLARTIPGITELTALTYPENTASKKILVNEGFKWTHESVQDGVLYQHFALNL